MKPLKQVRREIRLNSNRVSHVVVSQCSPARPAGLNPEVSPGSSRRGNASRCLIEDGGPLRRRLRLDTRGAAPADARPQGGATAKIPTSFGRSRGGSCGTCRRRSQNRARIPAPLPLIEIGTVRLRPGTKTHRSLVVICFWCGCRETARKGVLLFSGQAPALPKAPIHVLPGIPSGGSPRRRLARASYTGTPVDLCLQVRRSLPVAGRGPCPKEQHFVGRAVTPDGDCRRSCGLIVSGRPVLDPFCASGTMIS